MHQLWRFFLRSLQNFVRKQPHLASTIVFVLAAHLSVFIYSQVNRLSIPKFPKNHLVVKTTILPKETPLPSHQEKLKALLAQNNPHPTKKNTPAKDLSSPKTPTPVKKKNPSAQTAKKTQKQTPPLSKKTKQLLQDLEESLAKIESNHETPSSAKAMSVPKPILQLKANSYAIKADAAEDIDAGYKEALIQHLKETLCLPGYGIVKVKLTLGHFGKVNEVIVMFSDSEINRVYLEKTLYQLDFPSFSGELAHQDSFTFNLTFCSDQ